MLVEKHATPLPSNYIAPSAAGSSSDVISDSRNSYFTAYDCVVQSTSACDLSCIPRNQQLSIKIIDKVSLLSDLEPPFL